MAANYKPAQPFTVPLLLRKPTFAKISGVPVQTLDNGTLIYGSFRTFGGTDQVVDGLYSVVDTAEVETWYRPDITSACVIELADATGAQYEILGEPENINRRNQFLKLKVRRMKGGA